MIKWIDKHIKYIFTLPTVLFVITMIAFPVSYTFYLSFHEWSMSQSVPKVWIGIENYISVFSDPRFAGALWRTLYFAFIAVAIETVLGVAVALFISKVNRGVSFVKTVFLMPMVATPVAVGIVWKLIYEPTFGIANYFLKFLGIPAVNWLGSAKTVMPSIILIDVWQWTPMIMLVVLAGISGLPLAPFESAIVDGAGSVQVLTKVTLPLLSPTIFVAVLLRLIDALKTFDIIYSTTLGGPGYSSENLNILSYSVAFDHFYFGRASSLLVIFTVIVFGSTLAFLRVRKKLEVNY